MLFEKHIICVFVLRPLLFLFKWGRMKALGSAHKTDQVDFTDWMLFLPSNQMEEVGSDTEAASTNT